MKTQTVTWINVDDELPKDGQQVLCVQDPETTGTKEPLVGIFNASTKRFLCLQPTIYANLETGRGAWVDIIYWMPLPKTPKQLS
jgi:hypothetical protein